MQCSVASAARAVTGTARRRPPTQVWVGSRRAAVDAGLPFKELTDGAGSTVGGGARASDAAGVARVAPTERKLGLVASHHWRATEVTRLACHDEAVRGKSLKAKLCMRDVRRVVLKCSIVPCAQVHCIGEADCKHSISKPRSDADTCHEAFIGSAHNQRLPSKGGATPLLERIVVKELTCVARTRAQPVRLLLVSIRAANAATRR